MKRILLASLILLMVCGFAVADNTDRPLKQTQYSVTVTSTSTEIMAGNLKGRYILIQNNDTAGIVYLNLSGTATVSRTMFILNPGDALELFNITNSVDAIGSIASNANVAVSEGR